MVFFEAPHRLEATLADMAAAFGTGRSAALCRELTKTYEEVRRGSLAELLATAEGTRGEITLVVAGAVTLGEPGTAEDWTREVADLEAAGAQRKAAIAEVAERRGVPRREVYDAVARSKHAGHSPPAERK